MVRCHAEIFPAAAEKHFQLFKISALIISFFFLFFTLSIKPQNQRGKDSTVAQREIFQRKEVESSGGGQAGWSAYKAWE